MNLTRSLAATAAVCALVLAGCGDNDKDDDAKVGGPGSSESASDSPTTDEATDDESGTDAADEGEEVDKAAFLADLKEALEEPNSARTESTIITSGQEITTEGSMEYDGDEVAVEMTMSGDAFGGETAEARIVDKVMYMKVPGMSGGKFLALDLADPSGPLASMGGLADAMDPSKAATMYQEGISSVRLIGDEEIDGEDTEHYRIALDTTKVKAFQQLPPSVSIPKSVEYDLWLGEDDDLIRKMEMDIPGLTTMEMRVYDYGTDVDIEAPPASQVTSMPGMGG